MNQQLYGALLGTAVGDAYGLPFEGLSPQRIAKMSPQKALFRLIPLINGGMVSDDTEHAVMTVQAYIESSGNPLIFKQSLRRHLRYWLLRLPAGIGLATLRSIIKMWLGFGETGVYSAGNGGAMRAVVLGILADNLSELKQLVSISTRLTHTDPKAEQGALFIALLAWAEKQHYATEQTEALLGEHISDEKLIEIIKDFEPNSKRGVSGYMYETVPAVFLTWKTYRHQPLNGLQQLILWGGDTDTTGAIFAGLAGIHHGEALFKAIKGCWCEPTLRPNYFTKLVFQAIEVKENKVPQKPLKWAGISALMRNLLFMWIVLGHGFRRLFPPYK